MKGRWPYLVVGLGMIGLAALAGPSLVVRLSPDRTLHPDTILSIQFLRLFLAVLGVMACFWPDLASPRRRRLLVGLLVPLALSARAVRLNTTYLDQHAHRQTDVATIARNFYEKDPDILLPQVNWRADAPNYVESTFPLVPWLVALGYRAVGEQPWVGRALVALFAALAVVSTFGLVSLYWGQAAGFFAGLFVALSPLAVYFGRALIDDTPSMALALAGLWGVAVWARRDDRRALVLGVLAITLAALVKVVALYIYFPVAAVLWERWRWQALRRPLAWAILGLPLLPVAAWYAWAHALGQQYLSFGLGGKATTEPTAYLAASKWGSPDFVLRWAFLQRIGQRLQGEVLTWVGLAAALAGGWLAIRRRLPGLLVFGALLGGVVLLTLISGRAQFLHNYYQLPFVVALAPFVGLGLAALWEVTVSMPGKHDAAGKAARLTVGRWLALGLVLLFAAFSALKLPYYYDDWQGWILPEAELVQRLAGPQDRIITVTMEGDTALLYHLHRPGWVVDNTNAEALAAVPSHLQQGARLLILQDLEYPHTQALFDQPWLSGLELIQRTDHYAIYRAP